jgi:hypothetical protein
MDLVDTRKRTIWDTEGGVICTARRKRIPIQSTVPDGWTAVTPPEAAIYDGAPCQFVDGEWVLATTGELYEQWESEQAKKWLATEDDLGELSRPTEDLHAAFVAVCDILKTALPDTSADIDTALGKLVFLEQKIVERKEKRAKVK